ncbi:MAG: YceI family protein [Bacteroidota bacterium]
MFKALFTSLAVAALTVSAYAGDIEKKTVKVDQSSVTWKGKKVTGAHEGTIAIQSGSLDFENGTLVGGEFVIDMTTIAVTDLTGDMAGKLKGHLMSDDFFGVENHPTATLVFTTVDKTAEGYKITGNLTIKETTKPISFMATIDGSAATADITVDRTEYNVKYGSGKFFDGLGDKMIYDNFDLSVSLAY